MTRPLRLDGAIRTSKRKRDARSPQQQRDMIASCAQANGYEVLTVHDSGRDESGKTMDRETLNTVMERVRTGQTDGAIMAITDRLGRAPIEEAMAWVRQLTGIGYLVLADGGGQPIDLNDPQAESNLVFQLQMARQFWLTTANRAERTKVEAIAAGKFVGPTPLGYKREGGRLVEHPTEGPVIRQAFEIAAAAGLHAAADHLAAAFPRRRWSTDDTRKLLAARAYLGESYSGEHRNERAHDPLTDPATFRAAQTTPRMRRSRGDYPLSHAVHCGRCGEGLVGQLQSVKGRTYRRMRCSNPACKGGTSISADKLEAHVLDVMEQALGDEAFRARLAPEGLTEAKRALEAAEAQVQAWYTMPALRRQRLGDARYNDGLDLRLADEEIAREAHASIEGRAKDYERLPQADELRDPDQFAAGLRAITRVGRIVIAPGRGPVEVRTDYVALDRDDLPGALAA